MRAANAMITVTIVEDEPEIRRGLAALVDGTDAFRCLGTFGSFEDALRCIDREVPDVALVDIGLPGMSGIDGIRVLKQRFPRIQFLILTVFDDDARIFDALCAGACGYLLKNTPPARLLSSISEVMEGGAPMSPEVARRVIELFRHVRPPAEAAHNLTPHEVRLLKLLVEGHSYKTAAAELGASYHTVCFHMRNIYDKLHVHSKSEAVSKALRTGLVR